MHFTSDWRAVYEMYDVFESARAPLESWVSKQTSLPGYCAVCKRINLFSVGKGQAGWINLRGGLVCNECGLSSRLRSFVEAVLMSIPSAPEAMGLLFERITPLYGVLSQRLPGLTGCEYLGPDYRPGGLFITPNTRQRIGEIEVRHEDMQNLSYVDEELDFIIHSDVLEHVPDPSHGLAECMRVLKSNGVLLFACPIYATPTTRIIACLEDGQVKFKGEPVYHGDPLSEKGVPVFNNFGFDIFDLVKQVGFSEVEIGFTADYAAGYFSDANPWRHALMWHILVRAKK